MPDVTVSGNVDTMMRAADNAAIRSAIGLGQTDAPTFLAQSLTGQSLTGTQATNLLDLATTWDTTGTPTAIKVNATNTNSNPATKFIDLQLSTVSKFRVGKGGNIFSGANAVTADGGTGVAGVSLEMLFANYGIGVDGNGNCQFLLNGTARSRVGFGVCIGNNQTFSFSDLQHTGLNSVPDVLLARDAPGILAQRNGTTAQAFRVYNTYTDASNYERLNIQWSGNAMRIFPSAAGSGTPRIVYLGSDAIASTAFLVDSASNLLQMNTGGLNRWQVNSSGHFLANTDNLYDIGASGANRPRNIYVGTSIFTGVGGINFDVNARIRSPADSIVTLYNSALTDFGRLQLGGTTSAFPAIKRNGTGIDIVLANDSGFAPIKGKLTTDTNYAAGVPSATGYITIYDATGTAYRVPCTV
jgi:hypothetical protein